MRIPKLFVISPISDRLFENHLAKQRREATKYVRLPKEGLSDEYSETLRNTISTLANYLRHNKMALEVTSEQNLREAGQDRFVRFSLLDLKNNETSLMSVREPDKPKKKYELCSDNYYIFPIPQDGLEVARKVVSRREANLTEHIYRVVSDMVEQVKNVGTKQGK